MNYLIPRHSNDHEIMAAAPDYVATAAGVRVDRPHPLAEALSLPKIATACALAAMPRRHIETDTSIMSRGIGTSDFSRVLAQGVGALAVQTYDAQAEHLAFTVPMDVQDFKPVTIPAVDACGVELELLGQNAEIARGAAFLAAGAGAPVQITTFARVVGISRQAIVNDDLGAFASFVAGLGGSAARLEAQLLASALEANPLMDDGAVAFDAVHLNTEPEALSGPALGRAMAMLRNQRTAAGQLAGLRAKHLVVSSGDEFVACVLVKESGLDTTVTVSVLANLPAGRWFLLADPTACPVVATLRLAGVTKKVVVEQRKPPTTSDGAFVKVRADLGACLLRRTGIVRGGTI